MLVGKNNTGKSMAMMAVYAALGNAHQAALDFLRIVVSRRIAQQFEDDVASRPVIDLVSRASKPAFGELPQDLVEHLDHAAGSALAHYASALGPELSRVTGTAPFRLRRSRASMRARVSVSVWHGRPAWRLTVSLPHARATFDRPQPAEVWEEITEE